MNLRPAAAADAAAIARVHWAARRGAMPWLREPGSEEQATIWVREVLLPSGRVVVAVIEGAVVAFASVRDEWLEHLYVDPGYQGRGLGSALYEDAVSRGARQWWVFQRNIAARRFYERRGARAIHFTGGADNMEREPDVLYRLDAGATTPASS